MNKATITQSEIDKAIRTANDLIKSDNYLDNILGFALLTGRRSVEIMLTGEFEYNGKNSVSFVGQAKSDSTGMYDIYTLIEAKTVLKYWNLFLKKDKVKEVRRKEVNTDTAKYVNNLIAKNLSKRVKKAYDFEAVKDVTVHDLRAIYMLSSFNLYCDSDSDFLEYARLAGGHKNVSATHHYLKFKIN